MNAPWRPHAELALAGMQADLANRRRARATLGATERLAQEIATLAAAAEAITAVLAMDTERTERAKQHER